MSFTDRLPLRLSGWGLHKETWCQLFQEKSVVIHETKNVLTVLYSIVQDVMMSSVCGLVGLVGLVGQGTTIVCRTPVT